MWKWAHFRVGWCGSLPYMAMRSIRIRSITERHSLFPHSYIRIPYRLALRFAYHSIRNGEIRTCRVPCKWQWWVRFVLFTGSLDVRVTPQRQGVNRLLTFWFKPQISLGRGKLTTSLGLFYVTMFIRRSHWVNHTIKSRPSAERCYPPLTSAHVSVYSFRKGYFVRAASHNLITLNARTLRLLQTELQVQSMTL